MNKFSAPENEEEKPFPPPPLFVSDTGNPILFKKQLLDPIVKDIKMQMVNKSQIKVIVKSKKDYDKLKKAFADNNNIKFHVTRTACQ